MVDGRNWVNDGNLPAVIALNYQAFALGPHGLTSRFTYTVPAGRFAMLEAVQAIIVRDAVAAPASWANVYIRRGGSPFLTAAQFSNTLGDKDNAFLAEGALFLAGDTLDGFTSDFSTGGSHYYSLSATLREFTY